MINSTSIKKHFYARKGSILSLAGNLIFSLAGFLAISILARTFNLKEYGAWVIYLTAGSLIDMIRTGFMHTALVKFLSGTKGIKQKEYIGSGWMLGIIISLVISVSILLVFQLNDFTEQDPYYYFLKYAPYYFFAGLPQCIAISLLQFRLQFGKMLLLRLFFISLNLLLFTASSIFSLRLETVIIINLINNILTSLLAIITDWSGIRYIIYFSKIKLIELSHFGKFTLGTLIGTNLMKSADTFILGIMLNSETAALYSIPLKLTEVFEILLRSIVSVALPQMAMMHSQNQIKNVKHLFQKYSGLLTLLYIPLMTLCFIFSKELLIFLGGKNFAEAENIFKVFCFYGLLLPIDRFSGVTLDSINLPQKNFLKMIIMISFNISADLIILNFTHDLTYIALGTVMTTLIGILVGIKFLNLRFQTNLFGILKSGYDFLYSMNKKLILR